MRKGGGSLISLRRSIDDPTPTGCQRFDQDMLVALETTGKVPRLARPPVDVTVNKPSTTFSGDLQ